MTGEPQELWEIRSEIFGVRREQGLDFRFGSQSGQPMLQSEVELDVPLVGLAPDRRRYARTRRPNRSNISSRSSAATWGADRSRVDSTWSIPESAGITSAS